MNTSIEEKLKEKNINPTAMRMLVLDFMVKQQGALSLTDIEKGLAPADRITIYRSLKNFEEHGLVHSIDDGTGAPKYALCVDDCNTVSHHDLHVHFHCNTCQETFCLPNTTLPVITLPEGFHSGEMNLVVKGTCDKCK
ncbi:transcriptional repressor [Pedobacter sp. P351]|uniref:Fur family transcriptional regulator n=1 Tax=Pedobacter superstes TaxID=3133441 RepID=UPI0030B0973F